MSEKISLDSSDPYSLNFFKEKRANPYTPNVQGGIYRNALKNIFIQPLALQVMIV